MVFNRQYRHSNQQTVTYASPGPPSAISRSNNTDQSPVNNFSPTPRPTNSQGSRNQDTESLFVFIVVRQEIFYSRLRLSQTVDIRGKPSQKLVDTGSVYSYAEESNQQSITNRRNGSTIPVAVEFHLAIKINGNASISKFRYVPTLTSDLILGMKRLHRHKMPLADLERRDLE